MVLTANNAATYDSLAAQTEILQGLVKTANVNAPIFGDYMKAVSNTGSYIEWFDQNLKTTKVALSSTHTSGSGSFVLAASSLINPYTVVPGITRIMFGSGAAKFRVDDWDPNTRTATVTLTDGTDANLASGQYVRLVRQTPQGEDFGIQNDTSYATSDYNYLSNFSYTLRISNLNSSGKLKYHIDEITFPNQLANNVPEAMQMLEFLVVKDFRNQGTGATARNSNTIQSGNLSSAGGLIPLGSARSMYTVSSGSAVLGEDIFETDMIELRRRGAFTTATSTSRDMGLATCKAFVSEVTMADLQKDVRLKRAPESFYGQGDKQAGVAGTWATKFLANGVLLDVKISDAMTDNEVLYIPRDDLFEVQVLRMLEEQPSLAAGDNEVRMYECTYSTAVKSPWLLGSRTNLVRA